MTNTTNHAVRWLSALPFVRDVRVDGEVATIAFPTQAVRYHVARVAGSVRSRLARDLAARRPADADAWLVCADRVGPAVARALREAEVGFVDRAGNLYLAVGDRYVAWVEGKRHEAPRGATGLRGASYRVLFAALAQRFVFNWPDGSPREVPEELRDLRGPPLPSRTLRYVAAVSGTSTTAVTNLWGHLWRTGGLLRTDAGVVLADPRSAAESWWVGYRDLVRPRLIAGRIRLPGGGATALARTLDLSQGSRRWCWGGLQAAGILLQDPDALTRGPSWTVHVHDVEALDELPLEPDPGGPVLVLGSPGRLARVGSVAAGGPPVAHPLLVWSELRLAGDPRSEEIADAVAEDWGWTWGSGG